jgi:hypothetical protein
MKRWYDGVKGYCDNCGHHWTAHGAIIATCPDESRRTWVQTKPVKKKLLPAPESAVRDLTCRRIARRGSSLPYLSVL